MMFGTLKFEVFTYMLAISKMWLTSTRKFIAFVNAIVNSITTLISSNHMSLKLEKIDSIQIEYMLIYTGVDVQEKP
jgi:hypothetical protein